MKKRLNPRAFAKSNAYAAGIRTLPGKGIQQHTAHVMNRKQARAAVSKRNRR